MSGIAFLIFDIAALNDFLACTVAEAAAIVTKGETGEGGGR